MLKAIPWFLLGAGLLLGQQAALAEQFCTYESMPPMAPADRFTDNGDGTLTDIATGLQWKRCGEGQMWNGMTCIGNASTHTWQQALQLAVTASYAGWDDWRLPNIKELGSIVEEACFNPAIDLVAFPGMTSWVFWTSSTYAGYAGLAWIVNFHDGNDGNYYKESYYHVRLVRSGQFFTSPYP